MPRPQSAGDRKFKRSLDFIYCMDKESLTVKNRSRQKRFFFLKERKKSRLWLKKRFVSCEWFLKQHEEYLSCSPKSVSVAFKQLKQYPAFSQWCVKIVESIQRPRMCDITCSGIHFQWPWLGTVPHWNSTTKLNKLNEAESRCSEPGRRYCTTFL